MKVTNITEAQRKYVNFEYNSICYQSEGKICNHETKEFSIEYWKKNGKRFDKTCILKDLFDYFHYFMSIKLNNFVNLNRIKENNCGSNTIKVGTLWDGNKIGDLIFREVCYSNNIFIPVFLNYTIDNPEIISYKLFVADCKILLFDFDIPKSFIDEISNNFLTKYNKRIFLLPSDQILISNEITQNLNSVNFAKSELININSQKFSMYSENYVENLFAANKIGIDKVQEHTNTSNKSQISTINQSINNIETTHSFNEINNTSTKVEKEPEILKLENYSKVRNIVFTSGSTGKPKGVKLTFANYLGMINTLSILCNNNNNIKSIFVITNPLHHVNSTCFTEYCIRNSSKLILIHKYSKDYWQILNETIKISINNYGNNFSMIIPLVPKHFEYFCSMVENNYFEDSNEILTNLSHPSVNFFFGSSAVSNDLINEFKKLFNGKIPRIRFGSTETCLQLCGTDLLMNNSLLNTFFKMKTEYNEICSKSTKKKDGYFIGRSIQPFAEVFVVKSIDINTNDFLVPTSEFEVGHIICRGKTIMSGYINHENVLITKELVKNNNMDFTTQICNKLFICDNHPWYIGLGDQGYWIAGKIKNNSNSSTVHILGEGRQVVHINKDINIIIEEKLNSCACCKNNIFVDNVFLFWLSRSSSIIKIGGVKYSSEEINDRIVSTLKNLNKKKFPTSFFSTVICNKDDKFSEDDKVVFIYEPFEGSKNLEEFIRTELNYSKIPKSYIPYKIIETTIPKTFKGSIDREKLLEKIELK
ncbi:acyl- synthetases [Cryptosporidium sp. chipmunk genotype I]|uniref:acyl- synthetases n=1 Tax=Cryptosporidium sp. chipmunk genotype I TaxID=1280935 RepID=UPI00351A14B9|nr:acyl- synthetases [Cryptosporidium sp. chipmunk genotype I]